MGLRYRHDLKGLQAKWDREGKFLMGMGAFELFEHLGRDRINGQPSAGTGDSVLFLHPTFVYSPGHDRLFFGMVSVPVRRDFKDPASQDGHRFGTGVLYGW